MPRIPDRDAPDRAVCPHAEGTSCTLTAPPAASGLDAYAARFRADFRRSDQARWAAVYLHGLLLEGERKNMETMTRHVLNRADATVRAPTQALQNFIDQSPWDERLLLRRYRALLARLTGQTGRFLVVDLSVPKRGRESVGVQRQYSHEWGRKINCQQAVLVCHAGRGAPLPLALRLYLPRVWTRQPARLEATGVPEACRTPRSRGEIALDLLDELGDEGWRGDEVICGSGYASSAEFRHQLACRGRTAADPASGEPWRSQLLDTIHLCRRLRDDLGLGHFEGRSWRGFHHHAALVLLAHGFCLLREAGHA